MIEMFLYFCCMWVIIRVRITCYHYQYVRVNVVVPGVLWFVYTHNYIIPRIIGESDI